MGYVRVSSQRQADEGVSLEAQRQKLIAYATAMDLTLVDVIVDGGVSAMSLNRPGLARALQMLERDEAEGLLVVKLDRLTRSVRDLGDLVERYFAKRFALMSVLDSVDTRTAGGRLVLNVLASVSQWEREAGGERTREALAHVRSEGVRLGAEGMGWRRGNGRDDSGRREVHGVDEERETIDMMRELRSEGHSLRQICTTLTQRNRRTKRGGRWSPKVIASVLQRAST